MKSRLDRVGSERREQILRGACEVMTRKGFARASVREIADAAGMPVPTMYLYVRSKEDILHMIYERFLEEIRQRLADSLVNGRLPREKLLNLIQATMGTFDKYHAYVKLLFRETKSLGEKARESVFALDRSCIAMWRATLEECAAAEGFQIEQPELVANFIYYLCTVWAIRHWAIGGHGFKIVNEALCDFILRALREPPAHPIAGPTLPTR